MVIVKGFFKNPVIAFLSSLKLSAFLLVIVAVASARATFIESSVGRDGAYDLVYAATWFEVVLGLIVVSLTLLFIKRWPYKPQQWGFMLLHLSIIVILIGAAMTRYTGYEGIMPIREGATANFVYSDRSHLQATLGNQTATFPVRLWKPDDNNIWQNIALQGVDYELGVTEYWPHFTEVYQEGPGGPAGFNYTVAGHDHGGGHMLLQGDKATIGTADARYIRGDFSGGMSASRYGDLRLNIDGESCSYPVNPTSGEVMTCNGYRFEVIEFQSTFQVGGDANVDGPLNNPMIKVAITAPDGTKGERTFFAFHPEFSMGHSGAEVDFADLNMLFALNQGLEFASGGETGLQGRASFEMVGMDMNSEEEFAIAAGEVFTVREAVIYRDTSGDISFAPMKIMSSVVLAPAHSDNANNRAAARVVIRDKSGNQAEAVCMKQDRPKQVTLNGETFELAFGPVVKYLDYSVRLDDFVLNTYPGSDNPATYESYVTLIDEQAGVEKEVHVFMNHPMNYKGTKHFQSSYDQDRGGTILSVNHDPGKWPTYFGYMMISLGFILIIAKDTLFPVKKKSTKPATTAVAAMIAIMAMFGAAGNALAQDHPTGGSSQSSQSSQSTDNSGHSENDGHNHAPAATSSGFVALSDPARDIASHMIVQDYRGRMKPLDTMAREMVMKVARKSKFEGRQPVDQYLSWSLNPTFWWDKPVISLARSPGLKDMLGVSHETKYVSAASLFDERGQYRMADLVQEAHRTPNRDRSKAQRKLISFDERFNMLYICFRSQTLAIYPVPGDDNNKWKDFEQVRGDLNPEQVTAYEAAYTALMFGVQSGNNTQIMDGLSRTVALQQQYGAAVIPSDMTIKAELFYNKSHIWSWMMIPLLVAFVMLMGVYLVNLFRHGGKSLSYRNPFYSFGMLCYVIAFAGMILAYIMRWIASERIPISNGHESLLFISLAVALSGLVFELKYRMAAPASLGALLTTVVVGVSMLSMFDPAIGPLVPVLVSYWLNIHVTIITSSYGFLGLSALLGTLIMFLMLTKGEGRDNVRVAIKTLDNVNKHVLITGLGLLTVGTLLGGVWANESWGRYWGWDAKETWSLITILVYAVVLHFRWIPAMRSVWLNSAASAAAVSSVVMTYFGVNYFLSGLHSYGAGDPIPVPDWVFIGIGFLVALITISGVVNKMKSWGPRAS